MKEGLLERIRGFGHWRVNFRPVRASDKQLSLAECKAAVERSRVSMRGWDFPHVDFNGRDGNGGFERAENYVESWTDWYGFSEFWRMYRSSQFLAYVALREDTLREEHGNPNFTILDVTSTIYSVTEFVEFAHRLALHGLYEKGASISVMLRGTKDRRLSAGPGRMPFFDAFTTNAEQFEFTQSLSSDELRGDRARAFAIDTCLDLFDRFGWNPARAQIEAEQEKFYQRRV